MRCRLQIDTSRANNNGQYPDEQGNPEIKVASLQSQFAVNDD
jgi:hypothetical protein